MNPYIQEHKEEFTKAIDHLKQEFSHLRSGQANPELVDGVTVIAYDTPTPIKQLATITVPEPKMLMIQPWDKGILKDIEKAIIGANLGFSPVNDGEVIRIPMPPMTEENRRDLVKIVNTKTEDARIAIRRIRDKVKEAILQAEKDKDLSEDEKFAFLKQLDQFTSEKNDEVKKLSQEKADKIMQV